MLYICKVQELTIRHAAVRLLTGGICNYGKDYSSSDDEREQKIIKKKEENIAKTLKVASSLNEESASVKLNRLLSSMQTADDRMLLTKDIDIVTKPGGAQKKKKLELKQKMESKDIFAAARNVAALLDNKLQQQQTESELLSRLLGDKLTSKDSSGEDQNSAAGSSSKNDISLSELIVGMKIDRRQQQDEFSRSDYVRRSMAAKGKQQNKKQSQYFKTNHQIERKREAELYTGSVNLFGGETLGIFTDSVKLIDSNDMLPVWSFLHEQALKVQISRPPSNYFEKLANWTEQGKIWRFPIDNEQDFLSEKDVDFSEHIFLEQHIEDWCPNRGPVRHFMELVCVGLSKNPYITAKEKKDHIMWYKEYFESKKDMLKDLISDPKGDKNATDIVKFENK